MEANNATTTYTYDGFDNLTSVSQPGISGEAARIRSFTYDGLSRLLNSFNPESGWICYGSIPSNAAPNGSNCTSGWDLNSNLSSKTDARGITTSYAYDTLNRLLSKTYSDKTRAQFFGYDGNYDNGLGALAAPYNQNAIGRMTQSSDDTNIASSYAYDAMGRLIQKADCYPRIAATTMYRRPSTIWPAI